MIHECLECNEPFTKHTGTISTLLAYWSSDGHDHDDNCLKRVYVCANRHSTLISVIRSCDKFGCKWTGKTDCFCCPGTKQKAWPEEGGYMITDLDESIRYYP